MVPWGVRSMLICLLLDLTAEENFQQAFRVQPDDRTVHEGETALLKCEVDNLSGIVQWVKDGLLLGPNPNIPRFPRYRMVGEPSKGVYNLQITRAQVEDHGCYECQVGASETSSGIISKHVLLMVLTSPKKPLIKEFEANSTVTWVAGLQYTVTCEVEEVRPAAKITFSMDDYEVPVMTSNVQYTQSCKTDNPCKPGADEDSSSSSGTSPKLCSTKGVLRVIPQSSDNQKWLLCRASNKVSLIPAVVGFTLNILFPPQPPVIEGYNGPVKVKENLKLTCISVSGNPLAMLQWLKNGEVVSRKWETDDTNQLSRSVLPLILKMEDNMATVSCQASNRLLHLPMQASINLDVHFFPEEVKITGPSSIQENKSLSLSCSTSPSNPPMGLRWRLGWRELNATEVAFSESDHGGKISVSNLTYTALREDNDLSLICEAYNEAILFTKTATVTLRVYYPPQRIWIDAPPPEKRFRAGTIVKLTCFASGGNPLPRLDWYKTSEWIKGTRTVRDGISPGSSGSIVSKELILTMTPSDNMAIYRCNASSVSRTPALTAYTRLHVQFPPLDVTITATDKEVRRGQSLTLTCTSGTSNPASRLLWFLAGEKKEMQPPGYRWGSSFSAPREGRYHNGRTHTDSIPAVFRLNATDLGQKKAVYGGFNTSGKVTLVVSSADHGKRVECHAYSSVLSEAVNTFYQLTVLFPPEFSMEQLSKVSAMEHKAACLPLMVSASPPEITYRWSFLGKVLLTEGSPRHHLQENGSLEIWNVTRADAGKYRIRCENSEGHNETTIVLSVMYSPSIRSIGDPTYVDLGGTAEVVCQADAYPVREGMFQWKWLDDGEHSLSEMGFNQSSEGLVGRLQIQKAQRTHAGVYECQVDNGIPPAASSTARLVVRYPPEIMKGPGQRKVAAVGDETSEATLQCHAQGIPRVQFSWAKNGIPLDDHHGSRYTVRTEHEDSWHTSTLTIAHVSAVLDYATFTCTATNDLGTDTLDIQLLSTSRPDPPKGLVVLRVGHTWLTLQWTPGFDGGRQQSFRVRYHWPGAPSFMYVDVFPPQSSIFTLRGLHPNTPYNVSVNARNVLGESDFADGGAGLSVTTAERGREPVDGEPETPFQPEPESPALPFPLWLLGVLGGILIVSNLSFLGFLLYRRQTRAVKGDGTEAGARTKVRRSNNYTVSNWLKLCGQPAVSQKQSSEESTSAKLHRDVDGHCGRCTALVVAGLPH
ncbi:nephrin isoform X2 [Hemicordylus capensis]|uniref:nephrin isoform X2 n=1 Tax=Hemicordylus capensis TaxID=884348 RepID=UPI00230428D0|nr:nephrin isoform X2 [Hemicordylus capensis]